MEFHFATIWELIADTVAESTALICGAVRRSWREFDERASRVAGLLAEAGIGAGAKAAIYLHNCNEYLEAQYGIFKARACPINVNYRYKADELVYLLDNADCEAVFYQGCYAPRIQEIRNRLPRVALWVQIDDGTESLISGALDYERALAQSPAAPRIERSGKDVYMLYTGGTTGMPKGVMYPNDEFCRAMTAGYTARGLTPPESPEGVPPLVRQLREKGEVPRSLVACPLMHGTGMWVGAMAPLFLGGTVVTIPRLGFDPDLLFSLVERHRVTEITIVGDAFARPMLAALDAAAKAGTPYDLSSLRRITSSGVMWSREVKLGLLRHRDMTLLDAVGSTEGGMGISVTTRHASEATAKFALHPGVKVITDDGREARPGSGEIGKLATSRLVPIGYHKDPKKSAETFREYGGVRYSFPGDYARVEADGTITLLGRGSGCINTAGEKVFPEEIEEAVKRHPSVYDCLVMGLPDPRFGERVVAVVSARPGRDIDSQEIIDFAHGRLAGYKAPKEVVLVKEVPRTPNGKADYDSAKRAAREALSGTVPAPGETLK